MSLRPILLVEDDENDIFFFERAAKRAPLTNPVQVARDGREAILHLSSENNAYPCLVVLDLNLPHKNGLEVLQWIRSAASNPAVPVIVLTSSTAELDMLEAYRFGANSYLTKPSQPEELVELLRALKRYWLDLNRVPLAS
jgi:DNA-binding response OmpR family regulator